MNMSDIHAMPAQETKSRALPIVTAVVAAIMCFGLFGLPYLASNIDTSSAITPTSPIGTTGAADERAGCQRITESLCILLESDWTLGKAGSSYHNWEYQFLPNENVAQSAHLYIHDLTPVVSIKSGLEWWLDECAGYECATIKIETPSDRVEEIWLIDGTVTEAQGATYWVEDPSKKDVLTIGQFLVLLPVVSNGAVVLVDLTLDIPAGYLTSLTEVETQKFYSDVDWFFRYLITQRLQAIGS
jgi:hypothetical protein